MKKAVLTMAQEDFDFSVRQGKIEFSVEKVELEFVTEEVRKGSFSLKCDHDVPMKGFVYSTSSRMKLSGNWRHARGTRSATSPCGSIPLTAGCETG